MRAIVILYLVLATLFTAHQCHAQGIGKEGNRAVGVVFRQDGNAFPQGEATVGIFRRDEEVRDFANVDGVFCILIPKDVSEFQLVYRAAGYFSYLSPEMKSKSDPIKVEKVLLRKKDPNAKAQLENIDTLLETELIVYQGTTSPSMRKLMKGELKQFGESIEIPPSEPTFMTEEERKMRIKARISVDTAVVKMGPR